MRTLINIIFTTLISFAATSQVVDVVKEVKFREEAFGNGLTFPQVIIKENKQAEMKINGSIKRNLADLEKNTMCIGQYGFVQKGIYLQLHLYANCVELEDSENRFYLYNSETGAITDYANMTNHKRRKKFGPYLLEECQKYLGDKSDLITEELAEKIKKENLGAFKVHMTKNGLNISLENWVEKPLHLSWAQLREFILTNKA